MGGVEEGNWEGKSWKRGTENTEVVRRCYGQLKRKKRKKCLDGEGISREGKRGVHGRVSGVAIGGDIKCSAGGLGGCLERGSWSVRRGQGLF